MQDSKCILVVDDDSHVLFVLRHGLAKLGPEYQILASKNAQDALDVLDRSYIALLITDLCLPGMSGVELTELVREQDPAKPVIWITAHASAQTRNKGRELGVSGYLEKPLELNEIREAVRLALNG